MSTFSEEYARAYQAHRIQSAAAEHQARAARSARREARRAARAQRRAETSASTGRVAVARVA